MPQQVTAQEATAQQASDQVAADRGAAAQEVVDRVAADLQVLFRTLDNDARTSGLDAAGLGAEWGLAFTGALELRNAGTEPIPASGWVIRLSSIRRILRLDGPFEVVHVTGDLNELRPTEGFAGLAPGETITRALVGEYWQLYLSDVMPRWYAWAPGTQPRVLACTDTEELTRFVAELPEGQWLHSANDHNVYMTPTTRLRSIEQTPLVEAPRTRIVPAADLVEPRGGTVDLSGGISLALPLGADELEALTAAAAARGVPAGTYPVTGVDLDPSGGGVQGGYELTVGANGAVVGAADPAGFRHGVRTLLALLDPATSTVPAGRIVDAPRFAFRGLMVDIARNFVTLPTLHRLVEQMAAVKLNALHLHLADDEGWRLEIPGLPELTEVGGRRGHTLDESDRLFPQLGSGPGTDTSGTGWLTRADYIGLIRHAAARGVQIIPEIDMPAHCRAAVVAMEARYRRVLAEGGTEEAASAYRLHHPDGGTRLTTIQFYDRRSTLDPCLPSTLQFLDEVIGQVAAMHTEAGTPLEVWHYGGDEAVNVMLSPGFSDRADPQPETGIIDRSLHDPPWSGSPLVQAALARGELADTSEIPTWFATQVARIAARHGIGTLQAWEDGLKHATSAEQFPIRTRVNLWDPLAWGAVDALPRLERKGFEIVLSTPDHTYLDFPSEFNQHERGYYWGMRAVDLWRVFAWAPGNLPMSAELHPDRDGKPFALTGTEPVEPVLGVSAQVFGEMIRSDALFEAQVFPRLLSFAERAWHTPGWELAYTPGRRFEGGVTAHVDVAAVRADFAEHLAVLGARELPRLDHAGVAYRVGPPGAAIRDGLLWVRGWIPGIPCEYSVDGGASWRRWTAPVALDSRDAVLVRTTSADGSRASRVEQVDAPEPGAADAEPAAGRRRSG